MSLSVLLFFTRMVFLNVDFSVRKILFKIFFFSTIFSPKVKGMSQGGGEVINQGRNLLYQEGVIISDVYVTNGTFGTLRMLGC